MAALVTSPLRTVLPCSPLPEAPRLKEKEISSWGGGWEKLITAKYSSRLQTYSLSVSKQCWKKHTIPCHHPFHPSDMEENSLSRAVPSGDLKASVWSSHTISHHMKKKHSLTQTVKYKRKKKKPTQQSDIHHQCFYFYKKYRLALALETVSYLTDYSTRR